MIIDGRDKALLALLATNSRASTAELARELGMSRTTVSSRMERLEKRGVISGYTIRYSEDYDRGRIQAHVMISADPKQANNIATALKRNPAIRALHAINGSHDMLAIVNAESTHDLDQVLDSIGNTEGIHNTRSSIILSTKFKR
ncbi:MAG: Lrp/AsnC family transcriptional regulator [Gammaproteobacteria bacterium]|nr:Lrp/AsnC family transcriptional regulator [Gammaproteobacteria bacterium]